MFDEKEYIVNTFKRNFSIYNKEKLVIYGLGKNTKLILDEFKEYSIIGLMDSLRTGEEVWGLPVITCEKAKKIGVSKIIIVATSANLPLIYRRIAKDCERLDIDVFSIDGEKLTLNVNEYECPKYYQNMTWENLKQKIEKCDVISFDIFDTLLVRNTLFPTDVFENIAKKNKDILPKEFDYVKERVSMERGLYAQTNPKLSQIYKKMEVESNINKKIVNQLEDIELMEERNVLCPRYKIIEAMQYAKDNGKKVCCTSDMYISKENLKRILSENGIFPDELFVSCEYGVSKSNGLFGIVRDYYKDSIILHIGDNEEADIDFALKYGIDETFKISSIYKMAEDSELKSFLFDQMTLEERNTLGKILAYYFNNPFLFSETKGKIYIQSEYELGYFFIEPLIQTFVNWILNELAKKDKKVLLLGARDGWLLKNVLDIAAKHNKINTEYKYFYVSRKACTLAGMQTEKDVKYAAAMTFDGTIEELLRKRFLLNEDEILKRVDSEKDLEYLERHIPVILENAQWYKERYIKYISTLGLREEDDICFFDFVSSGTCQLWLEKIFDKKISGYYFIRNYEKHKKHLDIKSMYEPKYVYEKQNALFRNYIVLENIFSSPEPSLKYIGDEGEMIFETDTRTDFQIEEVIKVHKGILDAYSIYADEEMELGEEFVGNLLDILKDKYSLKSIDILKENNLVDDFCNRNFDVAKILES